MDGPSARPRPTIQPNPRTRGRHPVRFGPLVTDDDPADPKSRLTRYGTLPSALQLSLKGAIHVSRFCARQISMACAPLVESWAHIRSDFLLCIPLICLSPEPGRH